MWYYYSKKSCNSPRKIRYIRYLINRTTKRTTRMIIEKRKKKEEKSSARNIPPHPITSIYKNYQNSADSLFDQSVSSKNRGGGSGKKKIFSTLCEQCLRGGGTISRNMKTASKSDGGRSEIGKQRFAQSCARKAWNCVRRAIATNNYYQADPFVWHRRK